MANGPNWQIIAAIVASGLVGSVGTGGLISTNSATLRDIDQVHREMEGHATLNNLTELRDLFSREIIRIDGWIDEVARKQDDVRERLTVVEAKVDLQNVLRDLIIRLERLERKEE